MVRLDPLAFLVSLVSLVQLFPAGILLALEVSVPSPVRQQPGGHSAFAFGRAPSVTRLAVARRVPQRQSGRAGPAENCYNTGASQRSSFSSGSSLRAA